MNAKGYTLLETLVAVGIASLIGSGLLLALAGLQTGVLEISLAAERNENFRLLPLVLVQTLQSAGCGKPQQQPGIEDLGDRLVVRSDIDGPEGFPDGTLKQSFENIRFLLTGTTFRIQSGQGSFQPLATGIEGFEFQLLPPTDLRLSLEGEKRSDFNTEWDRRIELRFYLWNYCSTLFEKETGP